MGCNSEMAYLISIDASELKVEENYFKDFLEEKLNVKIDFNGKIMKINAANGAPSYSNVKDYIKRFIYRKGLSNAYKVRSEKDAIKIVKKKK